MHPTDDELDPEEFIDRTADADRAARWRSVVDQLRAAADAWAEQRYSYTIRDVTVTDHEAGVEHQWNVPLHAQWILTGGREGVQGTSSRAESLTRAMKHRIGRRLADIYLKASGAKVREIADALEQFEETWTAESETRPQAIRAVEAWFLERFGEGSETAADVAFREFLEAFVRIDREQTKQREADKDRQLAAPRIPKLRQGLTALRATLTTGAHVKKASRKIAGRGALSAQQVEARRLFRYEPLGVYERLVVHGLAALAREAGLLEAHPMAGRPMAGAEYAGVPAAMYRVRIPFPGISELARIIGVEPDASGKIARADRSAVERALVKLCTVPRWIAMPLFVKAGNRLVEDREVVQTLWVEASETELTQSNFLHLHPAAFLSHVRSYVEVPNLAATYERARIALGKRQLRDEWAIADDYMRSLAFAQVQAAKSSKRILPAANGAVAGVQVVTKRIAHSTLLTTLDLVGLAKKEGQRPALNRVREALEFCRHTGSLVAYEPDPDEHMWDLTLPHPDTRNVDPEQLVIFQDAEAVTPEVGHP